jgi:hypothetical protein
VNLNLAAALDVLEPETPYVRGEVATDAALLGVEADALAYDCGFRTGAAPYCVGELEADCQGAWFGGAGAEGVFFVEGVGGDCAFDFWRDVASHVEALHGCGCCGLWPVSVDVRMLR